MLVNIAGTLHSKKLWDSFGNLQEIDFAVFCALLLEVNRVTCGFCQLLIVAF